MTPEARRARRLAGWSLGVTAAIFGLSVGLTVLVPPATSGARALLAFCGIG